ncbi:MAG: type II toxin-antitoxin system RelE/ParE family toxin [Petrimonas sp.]|nr:type II toxin-antitoxin system RelE/ParE family toxin [Petrimonas sp.]
MKSGYKVLWTNHALRELEQTIRYLRERFSEKEIRKLAQKIENTTELISLNPTIFPKSEKQHVHKAVILKYNTLYYRVKGNQIHVLSFFSNRQNPKKRKI